MISSGDVFLCPPNAQPLEGAAIVSISLGAKVFSWDSRLGEEKLNGVLTENHWTRFNAKDVSKHGLTCVVSFDTLHTAWLAQANHIFSRLQITSNLEDYVLVDEVEFRIAIGNTRQDAPPGYLFLCPTTDLQTGLLSFRWPDYPAYWSLDPSGADRLSSEEATQLGFPSFQLTSKFEGLSWDTSVYAGLRQFHQAKGFDPDSQDVARDTGYPLYRLSREVNSLFAHMEEDWSDDGTDEGETDDEWEDAQSSVEVEQDGDKSTENSDANEDEGPLNVCTEPPEQNTAEARQDPAHSVGHAPNPADSHVFRTGIGFIHRIIGGLQRGLVIESENLDTDPISPFLV
ncbi:hypothetical protein B0H16DRAFT_1700198 [Mycena metata]|uniref:Uncharacterized protein n=1 Tax=Mycena metata TaxID=1033252 RepID=A0AAD7HFG2_9AGAR|nr:hypothetical protein B0H16DRAFT_1700198 [Mycena metata]